MADTSIEWIQIPGFPDYLVNRSGEIYSLKTNKVLSPIKADDGHLYVFLYLDGNKTKMWVHRAVLLAFDREPVPGEECRHLDGNPQNNYRSNLCWGTKQQNSDDKKLHGTLPVGERSGTHKLTESQVIEIRQRYGTKSSRELGKEYGVSHCAIRRAALGIKWSCVKEGLNHG